MPCAVSGADMGDDMGGCTLPLRGSGGPPLGNFENFNENGCPLVQSGECVIANLHLAIQLLRSYGGSNSFYLLYL